MHISNINLSRRLLAWVAILFADLFYTYNFVVIDYVRPFIVDSYEGITLANTAQFYAWQSGGAVLGALICAKLNDIIGRKNAIVLITALSGILTILNLQTTSLVGWSMARFAIGFVCGGYFVASISNQLNLFEHKVHGTVTSISNSMFSIALIIIGALAAYLSAKSLAWENILWVGGFGPIAVAVILYFVIPNPKKYIGLDDAVNDQNPQQETQQGTWAEIFKGHTLKITILCTLLAGLNFYGYQFFAGFVTTYLKEVRQFDDTTVGIIFSVAGFGSFIGCWIWGMIADKWGRKICAFGFFGAGILVSLFFFAPSNVTIGGVNMLAILGLLYNFCLSSSAVWGAYFAELFPAHLRTFGVSLFHVGRIIGMWAPMALVFIQARTDLETAMWGTPILWIFAGFIWALLPETINDGLFSRKKNTTMEPAIA